MNPDSYLVYPTTILLRKKKSFIRNLKILKCKFENLGEMDSFSENYNSMKWTQGVGNY